MLINPNMVSSKGPSAPQTTSKFFDHSQGFSLAERHFVTSLREELITWSMYQTRENLVEWFSFELERFIEHLEDGELGISEAARELEMPRNIRREIERDARRSAKKRAELVAKLRKLQKELPSKSKGKEF